MRRANWVGQCPQHNRLNTGNPITRGLVLYMPLNEGGGKIIKNPVFNADMTITGAPYQDGLIFDGTTSRYFATTNTPTINFTYFLTVSAWIKLYANTTGVVYDIINKYTNITNSRSWRLRAHRG